MVRVLVSGSDDNEPLVACAVAIGDHSLQTDLDGLAWINLNTGTYPVKAAYVGYRPWQSTLRLAAGASDTTLVIRLEPDQIALKEITISAKESTGMTSASRIDRGAMAHLQPSSFTDLLELLPGNISQNPDMGQVNSIKLRETGNIGATGTVSDNADYAMSALGTLFNVDGAPVATDANLQSTGIEAATGRNAVNRGVDMRSLSTDNIESVEIVRGIPSAEYGNLTSGMVDIRRTRRATPFTARFKADGYSKLLFAGKGIAIGANTLNLDAGYLDSKVDPRNNLENYKRITASARAALHWQRSNLLTDWNISADFTGTIDRAKTDPDLSLIKIDEYKSDSRRYAITSALTLNFPSLKWLRKTQFNVSASYQDDRLTRRRQVAPQRATVAPVSMEEGIHDGAFILGEYIAEYLSEGRPLSLYAKASISGPLNLGPLSNEWKAGADWSMSKNYGRGQVYDPAKPLSASWTSRPRAFSDIPALNIVSAYLEDAATVPVGANTLELQAGVRMAALAGRASRYAIAGKPYLDPRVNVSWHFPSISAGSRALDMFLAGGYGIGTRMPTVDYLFPQAAYLDLLQLSYYDNVNPQELSRVNLRTYINDAVNYGLRPARNRKWEIRLGAEIGANKLSVTYFDEHMTDGFRYSNVYAPYDYRQYDPSGIPAGSLTAPPSLDDLPYVDRTVLRGFRQATNGSRIDKRGIEFQLTTARWRPLATSLILSGAWFRSRYSNSQMLFDPVSTVVNGNAVSDRYVGLYATDEGRINDQFNTNFMFDTQIPKLGLVISTTFQCMWYVKTRRLAENGTPLSYLDALDGMLHPYDYDNLPDPALAYLTQFYNPDLYASFTIPTAVYVNIKATKTIGKWLRMAVFVNRILDYLPSYTSNGLTVRRSSDAYFGMELNFTL